MGVLNIEEMTDRHWHDMPDKPRPETVTAKQLLDRQRDAVSGVNAEMIRNARRARTWKRAARRYRQRYANAEEQRKRVLSENFRILAERDGLHKSYSSLQETCARLRNRVEMLQQNVEFHRSIAEKLEAELHRIDEMYMLQRVEQIQIELPADAVVYNSESDRP